MDVGEIISGARAPERAVLLCLRGDLQAQAEMLDVQIKALRERKSDSLLGDGSPELLAQFETLRQEMLASTVTFRLRAVNMRRLRDLVALNPPREDDAEGKRAGYDLVRMTAMLARECCYQVDAPDGSSSVLSDDQWDHLLGPLDDSGSGVLSVAQFRVLDDALTQLSFGQVSVPFSRSASQDHQG